MNSQPVSTVNQTELVSAVIPTVLRKSLPAAIASVRAQEGVPPVQVIVAVDRDPETLTATEWALLADADDVVFTNGKKRGGAARNLGVANAKGDWVAFLDDDDEWLPGKLRAQLDHVAENGHPRNLVVSCRVSQGVPGAARPLVELPSGLIGGDQMVADYLFRSRGFRVDRPALFTSTLLVSSELARECPWEESLSRHQDWDWLLRLERQAAARISHAPVVGVNIWMQSDHSISAGADWLTSLTWIRKWKSQISQQAYVDFLAGQVLRYSLHARSARGVLACIREIAAARRVPTLRTLVLGIGGLVSRGAAVKFVLARAAGRSTSQG